MSLTCSMACSIRFPAVREIDTFRDILFQSFGCGEKLQKQLLKEKMIAKKIMKQLHVKPLRLDGDSIVAMAALDFLPLTRVQTCAQQYHVRKKSFHSFLDQQMFNFVAWTRLGTCKI